MRFSIKPFTFLCGLLFINSNAFAHSHHQHGIPLTDSEKRASEGIFTDNEVKDRALSDWEGVWQSLYPYTLNGRLDPIFNYKAKRDRTKTFTDIKHYYQKGYATDIDMVGIEEGMIEFHVGKTVTSCHYDYAGYKILTYPSGLKGVRYLFECHDDQSQAPKYVQFSDHAIAPRKATHFHMLVGNTSQQALLSDVTHWPTYYLYQWSIHDIIHDMHHH